MDTPRFREALDEVARATERPLAEVRREAETDLRQMSASPGRITVSAWARFCRWMTRAYNLDVDQRALADLKDLNTRTSLVFLPNHRSYLDPVVLRSALMLQGFPPNSVLSGANLAMWPLSSIGKRNGVVFIRREIGGDLVYRAVLRAYLAYLIERRSNLEWYIEGGRTRSGKLRPPRYGVLSYLIDAYSEHPDNDVHIVPVSIVYDQQHEVEAISAEESGADKSAESLMWLYRFATSQSRRLGRAHVRFGEPLSLADTVSLAEDEHGNPRPRLAVPKVAFEVANRINAVTPITPVSLVTLALLDNEDRAITVGEGVRILRPLLDYMALKRLPTTSNVDMTRHGGLAMALDRLIAEGVVHKYDGGDEPVFVIPRDRHHEAAFYRNTIAHFLVNRAITELAMLSAAQDDLDDITASTWEHARRLKDLLKFEFFFPSTADFADELAAEASNVVPDWQDGVSSAQAHRIFDDVDLHVAHRILAPFLEAYGVMFERLAARNPAVAIHRDDLVAECLALAHQRWLQHLLHSAESISKDLFTNAIKLADNLDLLEPGGPELKRRRQDMSDRIQRYLQMVTRVRRQSRERLREYLRGATPLGGQL